MPDVALPAQEVGHFLFQQFLSQALGTQAHQRAPHVSSAVDAGFQHAVDLFPNPLAWCYDNYR